MARKLSISLIWFLFHLSYASNNAYQSNELINLNSKSSSIISNNYEWQLYEEQLNLTKKHVGCTSEQCTPGNWSRSLQCHYIKHCCGDTLSSGALINYLTMQYCFFNTVQPLGIIVLCILVFYAFLILGNVADDYFAPTMAELADFLGVSHELAGVTFVAFGNGAPDISSSVAAITQGGDTTKLGLGALLGAAVFDPIAVSGVIAMVVSNPQVARRPFLRDCFFLFISAGCVLFITSDHEVTLLEALGMIIIYIGYVGAVLLGEIYKKLRRKKKKEERQRKKSKSIEPPRQATITDKILPVLGVFSNDSMRDLFKDKHNKHGKQSFIRQYNVNNQGDLDPIDSDGDDDDDDDDIDIDINLGDDGDRDVKKMIPIPKQPFIQPRQSSTPFISRQDSANTVVPYIQDLYHQLEEDHHTHHSHHKHHTHHKHVHHADKDKTDDNEQDDDDDSDSSSEASIGSSNSSEEGDRVWWKSLLIYTLQGPTLLTNLMCLVTIPLCDKHWNDWYAIISCITGPPFVMFAFGGSASLTYIIDFGDDQVKIPLVLVVFIFGLFIAIFVWFRIRIKYITFKMKVRMYTDKFGNSLNDPLLINTAARDTRTTFTAGNSNSNSSMVNNSSMGAASGGNGFVDVNKSGMLHSSTSILTSQNNNKKQPVLVTTDLKAPNIGDDDVDDPHETLSELKRRDPQKEPVMKLFFLILGFFTAVAWIEIVANELVNLLTTLGVISTIDLTLLGLTVLAWGNSIGDMIADVSVSRRGYAKMGISAAIGGPTLNILIGVGLGMTINTLSASNYKTSVPDSDNITLCCIAVMIGIGIYAVWCAISKWILTRNFGYFCFVFYGAFLVFNVLVYEEVISW